jgi:hypothetical protein
VPYQLKLKYTEGRLVHSPRGDDFYYTLAEPVPFQDNDGNELWANCVYLPLDVGERINAQRFQQGEPFFVRKAWKDKRGTKVQWDLWRPKPDEIYQSPNVERAATATGIPATPLERTLRASLTPNHPEYVAPNTSTRAEPVPINRNATRAPVQPPLRPG